MVDSVLHDLVAKGAFLFGDRARLLKLRFPEASPFPEGTLLPQALKGEESLSRCYRYQLDCLSPDAYLELNDVFGQPVEIALLLADGSERLVTGLVTGVESLDTNGGFARFRLTVEPALATLGKRFNSRVFQDQSVVEITRAILDEHIAANPAIARSFRHETRVSQRYPKRSYCSQYRESDLAFIERLLAEEGSFRKYVAEMQDIARRLRVREETEVPTEPGICLELGFVPEADGRYHEMTSIGFRFPEYPDVSFSITTTKTDRVIPDDSLDAAVTGGKMEAEASGLGGWYSRIKTLREGERRIGGWVGAEKLAHLPSQESGKPSTQEFAFRFVGAPKDMFRPYADVEMTTGIEENTKGELEPSLKDKEAVFLWDRLTGSIRARPATPLPPPPATGGPDDPIDYGKFVPGSPRRPG